jgi:hypothetical protein
MSKCSFLVVAILFLHQTSLVEKYFPVLQHWVSLLVPLILVSNPRWLALFLPMLVKGRALTVSAKWWS